MRTALPTVESRVQAALDDNALIPAGAPVIVGVSGGPDSIALLSLLAALRPASRLTGVYVDHQLRPAETRAEQELVRQCCQRLNIDFTTTSIDVNGEMQRTGESLEECARRLRYDFLKKTGRNLKTDLIAVGHTADDQAEEILIRLLRGSSLKGLSGMAPANGRIIRPLLDISKSDLLEYLHHRGIPYCRDSSNTSRSFLRNRVRLDLLPHLEDNYNPSLRQTLVHTAALLRTEEEYLAGAAASAGEALVSKREYREDGIRIVEFRIPCDLFACHHLAIRRRVIETTCWRCNSRPTFAAIARIIELAANGRTGAELHLQGGLRVIKTASDVVLRSSREPTASRSRRLPAAERFELTLDVPEPGSYSCPPLGITLTIRSTAAPPQPAPSMLVVDADLVGFPLLLRAPLPGEKIRPFGSSGSKKISRLLADRKIPRYRRSRYPVLVSGERVIAIAGLEISDRVRTSPATSRYLVISWSERC